MSGRETLRLGPGGKDVVVVGAREELAAPSRVTLPPPAPQPGLLLPDGSINWGCPCLGGMATGPCATQFRDAFSCFHYSEAEPKGSDCYEKFSVMQSCMAQYPELYGKEEDDELTAAVDVAKDGVGAAGGEPTDAAGTAGGAAGDAAETSQNRSGALNAAKEMSRSTS